MGVFTVGTPDGQKLDIEAENENAAISGAKEWYSANSKFNSIQDTAIDVGKSAAIGPVKAGIGLLGLPGEIQQAIKSSSPTATPNAAGKIPYVDPSPLPTGKDVRAGLEQYTGPIYDPKTALGGYAQSATEAMTGSMIGPGGMMMKAGSGLLSGLGSEAAGNVFAGTAVEPYARFAGGIVGGFGNIGTAKTIEAGKNFVAARKAGDEIGKILGTDAVKAGAVRRVGQSAADDELTVLKAQQLQSQYGGNSAARHEDTMMMDLGRQMQGRAEQMALHPGKSQNTVLDAVEGRTGEFGSGARSRIAETLDQYLGPPRNVVHIMDDVDRIVQTHARPAYEKVMEKHPVVWDATLENLSQRPAIAQAMRNAHTVAANYGETITGATPSLKYWDYVKKSVDQRINGMMRSGMDDLGSAEKADLGGLISAKQALVQHLDSLTGGEYATARRIAATKPELHEAMDFGRSIFNSKLLPEEVSAHIGDLSLPGQAMAQAGARRELERVLDSVRNDGAKARNFLDTNNNLQKIRDQFGPDAATAIENRVAAENKFQSSTETVARNSRTAVRQELAKDTATPNAGDYHTTLTGVVTAPFKSGMAYALEHGMGNTREDISKILTAKGAQITPVVEQLMKYNAKRASNASPPVGDQLKALVRALAATQAAQ